MGIGNIDISSVIFFSAMVIVISISVIVIASVIVGESHSEPMKVAVVPLNYSGVEVFLGSAFSPELAAERAALMLNGFFEEHPEVLPVGNIFTSRYKKGGEFFHSIMQRYELSDMS